MNPVVARDKREREKVIAYLDSDEGRKWARRKFHAPDRVRRPLLGQAGAAPPVTLGPCDPAEDPCGRPPLGERA